MYFPKYNEVNNPAIDRSYLTDVEIMLPYSGDVNNRALVSEWNIRFYTVDDAGKAVIKSLSDSHIFASAPSEKVDPKFPLSFKFKAGWGSPGVIVCSSATAEEGGVASKKVYIVLNHSQRDGAKATPLYKQLDINVSDIQATVANFVIVKQDESYKELGYFISVDPSIFIGSESSSSGEMHVARLIIRLQAHEWTQSLQFYQPGRFGGISFISPLFPVAIATDGKVKATILDQLGNPARGVIGATLRVSARTVLGDGAIKLWEHEQSSQQGAELEFPDVFSAKGLRYTIKAQLNEDEAREVTFDCAPPT